MVKTVTGPAHTVTNEWETNRDILDYKENKAGTTLVSKYDYLVNAIGQRSNVAQSGTAFASSRDIAWGYDSLGQVTSADSTIPGLDRAYQFDLIGNRLKTADSLTLPVANNYTPNALNQYTAIDTLNPVHDDDGNMTAGPLPANITANSTLTWDGENRLISASVPGGNTVTFIYDSQSRRIAETVGTVTKIKVYDGWNPIAEYSISNNQYSISKTYLWGMDLSGTLQGAGGVGGLLAVTDSTGTYYPTYDGNGNISEYLDSTGAVVAHYEYDPFGKTTVASGSKAQDFSHRFSTKPLDLTTGLYYYAYRYYDLVTGRWPSRDPIEEMGGINLYGFVGNDGVNQWDILGLAWEFGTLGDKPSKFKTYKSQESTLRDRDTYNNLKNDARYFGLISSFAKTLADKYLSAKGGDYNAILEMGKMKQVDAGLRTTIEAILLSGARFADRSATSKASEIFYDAGGDSSGGWFLTSSSERYIHYALGNFYVGVAGRTWCTQEDGKTMIVYQQYWALDDIYDFDNTDDPATLFSNDSDWYRMAVVGKAKQIRVTGDRWGTSWKWEKGNPPKSVPAP